ncbi:hypothetical protein KORDIASMS9_01919 [Kordia sp. SMS9]|nr:hypothetical protein KORDIASMS9_01919 [Kordia sp. SMS9]
MLEALEDSENLNSLAKITASGTLSAYNRAVKTHDEIVYVNDGKVVRKVKGKEVEVIQNLITRKVVKGTTITIRK